MTSRSCTVIVSAVDPLLLNWTEMILLADGLRSTFTSALAEAGIIAGWSVEARTATFALHIPRQRRAPEDPFVMQRTVTSHSHERLVCDAVSAKAADDARIVPVASAPEPQ